MSSPMDTPPPTPVEPTPVEPTPPQPTVAQPTSAQQLTQPAQPVTTQPAPPTTAPHDTFIAGPAREKNLLGLIAFVVAAVGFIFACIPGALIIGWVLLPIAFILALVSLFIKGKSKTFGLIGLVLSVVGTVVGVVVFMSVVATSVDEAFSGGETSAVTPADTNGDAAVSSEVQSDTAEELGTRAHPFPIGTAITQGDWTVTINSVNLDATAELSATSLYNEAPDAGTTYAIINLTATYHGTIADGEMPWTSVEYVTVDGNTISVTDKFLMAPDSFDLTATLYEGASVTGNQALQIPADTAAEGVLAVRPTLMGDKVFVAVL